MADVEKDQDKKTNQLKNSSKLPAPTREWLYVTLAVSAVVLAFSLGYNCAVHRHNQKLFTQSFVGRGGMMGDGPVSFSTSTSGGVMMGEGRIGARAMLEDDSHFNGVVTAVSGKNFTIAGNGASTSVDTTSSTQYQGGNTVKQNDSVVVLGTKSGDTITATKVIINP